MTALMLALTIAGLAMTFSSGVWGMRHPGQRGEPIGRARLVAFLVGRVGALLAAANFVISFVG